MQKIDPSSPKAQLRKSLLQTRQAMSPAVWQQKSQQICAQLQQSGWLNQARTILAYSSLRQEPDLSKLLNANAARWGLPRCVEKSLSWHLWNPEFPLQAGRYGLLEPRPDAPQITAAEVDLILVPAVACDRSGYRLGYGGGFYDRLLSQPDWRKIPTVGVVFEFALLPELPTEAWDWPLQAICTESGLFEPPHHLA
ncbi:MAG: 5-formyltetrahydrofolate cyclo-ligase [Pegethrix bostrychoides GSE-TBD4-15B]|jgi:5-formyltetrahydrofolate cyclo-ligase|uniref:5-formyltetrahydrofolate cyclo-ligase n=1 Tax=Pegethrix bostrychoides GSE-TBD4-15B TaxID=2839662 RepID=A0A951U5B2_9CYAN|nr:5-formyltetrahydrofolate cyclo-ligase [Pegethrix bostrychoides GSE-TBD4-15B]